MDQWLRASPNARWVHGQATGEESEIVLENGLRPTLMTCLNGGMKEKEWRGVK